LYLILSSFIIFISSKILLLTVFSIVSLAQNLVENVNNQVLLTPKKTTKDHLVEAFIEFYDIKEK
jgi:hypothetical protein